MIIKRLAQAWENIVDDVNIYPNPVKGIMTVEASEYQFLEIFDFAGRCVASREVNCITNIDMSRMAKGVYFVKMIGGNGTSTKKVIVE